MLQLDLLPLQWGSSPADGKHFPPPGLAPEQVSHLGSPPAEPSPKVGLGSSPVDPAGNHAQLCFWILGQVQAVAEALLQRTHQVVTSFLIKTGQAGDLVKDRGEGPILAPKMFLSQGLSK